MAPGGEVAGALDCGEQAERRSAQSFGREVGDGGVFSGLSAANPETGGEKAGAEQDEWNSPDFAES